jgi:hypothetical protein
VSVSFAGFVTGDAMAALLTDNLDKLNYDLRTMRDKGARWWNFSVSHTTFNIVIGDPLGKDNIVLCLPGCGYLSGPVEWPNQQIEVKNVGDSTIIEDRTVGFRAQGGRLQWRKNYDIWSFQGIWNARGSGPEPGIGIDGVMTRFRHWVSRYYEGEIGFSELAYQTNAVLWYTLPASGNSSDTAGPQAD